jgi:hypothetical protein
MENLIMATTEQSTRREIATEILREFETPIHDAKLMAWLLAETLNVSLMDRRLTNKRRPGDDWLIRIGDTEMDALSFAWSDVLSRTEALEKAWHAAWDREVRRPPADPIIAAIEAYHEGAKAFDATPGDDDETVAATYGPPLEVLETWTAPAVTFEGALEALRLVSKENHRFGDRMMINLLDAALAYFEAQAGQRN